MAYAMTVTDAYTTMLRWFMREDHFLSADNAGQCLYRSETQPLDFEGRQQ